MGCAQQRQEAVAPKNFGRVGLCARHNPNGRGAGRTLRFLPYVGRVLRPNKLQAVFPNQD